MSSREAGSHFIKQGGRWMEQGHGGGIQGLGFDLLSMRPRGYQLFTMSGFLVVLIKDSLFDRQIVFKANEDARQGQGSRVRVESSAGRVTEERLKRTLQGVGILGDPCLSLHHFLGESGNDTCVIGYLDSILNSFQTAHRENTSCKEIKLNYNFSIEINLPILASSLFIAFWMFLLVLICEKRILLSMTLSCLIPSELLLSTTLSVWLFLGSA